MAARWRWMAASGLLVLAGLFTQLSVGRHWALCRANALSRSCLDLEDATYGLPLWSDHAHRDPVATALAAASALAMASAWFMVTGWARQSRIRTVMFIVIGLQPLVDAALIGLDVVWPDAFFPLASSGWISLPAEVLILPMLLGSGWLLEASARHTVLLMVLGWAVTSYGSMHRFGDYVITMMQHPTLHQSPAGLGYPTALTQIGLGVTLAVVALALESGPRPDERFGPDGYLLAA